MAADCVARGIQVAFNQKACELVGALSRGRHHLVGITRRARNDAPYHLVTSYFDQCLQMQLTSAGGIQVQNKIGRWDRSTAGRNRMGHNRPVAVGSCNTLAAQARDDSYRNKSSKESGLLRQRPCRCETTAF